MKKIYTLCAAWLISTLTPAHATDNMQAYPAATQTQERYVLQLPTKKDESMYQVELIVGKTVQLDPANQYFFGGTIEEEAIPGWGYTRYLVNNIGPMAGTLMAVEHNAPKVKRFVTLGGDPKLVRYNSRLPIVVYTPKGFEVRYRIWTTPAKTKTMLKG